MPCIERSIEIEVPLENAFAFVTDIRNHGRVVPPQTQEQLLDAGEIPLRLNTVVRLRARYGGVRWTLVSQITAFDPPNHSHPEIAHFRDEQVRGPFAVWKHDHWFRSTSTGSTCLTDRFTYAAPFGLLGKLAERFWLNNQLRYLLDHIHRTQKHILESESSVQQPTAADT